jgi:PAT family beta-lactamase induction signal transducer AmpG
MAMTATPGIAAIRPPRLLLVLTGLYLAQTIPGALFVNAIPPILRQEGVTRTALGALGLLALPGVLKFLWAPLVDRLRPFARAHRAGWIVLTQTGVILAVLSLLLIRPGDLLGFIPIAFAIAMLLSTQDVATDGYATLALPPGRRAAGNAVQSGAAAAGVVLGGSFGLLLYHQFGWSTMVLGIAGLCLLPLAAVPAMREGRPAEAGPAPAARPRIMAFLQRPEARRILWVALLFRASEGLVRPMEAPYLVDARVGLDTIALLTGAAAAVAGLAGTVLLAWLLQRRGPAVALGLIGTLRVLACLVFALHATHLLPGMPLLFGAAAMQSLIRYSELVVLFSLFMDVASPSQPGTDFTILACAQYGAYLLGSILSGTLADTFGYASLFSLGTVLSVVVLAGSLALLRGRHRAAGDVTARTAQ